MRRTKIVCTLGPATSSLEKIRELIHAGMDVARLNFSHGSHEEHALVAGRVRQAAEEAGRHIALLQDLCGPKIRTGRLRRGRAVLRQGRQLLLTSEDIVGVGSRISISYDRLVEDVHPGDKILLDDGAIELRVLGTSDHDVVTEVIHGGELKEHKGVNLPGVRLTVESVTAKDEDDLRFGLEMGVDYVAISFVRRAADVRRVMALLAREKADIPVLAKLEKPEAVDNLNAILGAANGVMVARGDLGVELPLERVPIIQKRIIHRAAWFKAPVITATQMLESMTSSPRPTRAEASDVVNAIFDGSDAVMLSGETATGQYPVETVRMMARIARQADENRREEVERRQRHSASIPDTISESVVHAAHRLGVKAVLLFTQTGTTARMISKYRPACPIYAFCQDERIARRAMLYWGVTPFVLPITSDIQAAVTAAKAELIRRKLVGRGDILAVVAGTIRRLGQTNTMQLLRVGK